MLVSQSAEVHSQVCCFILKLGFKQGQVTKAGVLISENSYGR